MRPPEAHRGVDAPVESAGCRSGTGLLTAVRLLEFLRPFLRHSRRSAFLVVDGRPAHTARGVTQFVQATPRRLDLDVLPGYAPDFDPDEFGRSHLRHSSIWLPSTLARPA